MAKSKSVTTEDLAIMVQSGFASMEERFDKRMKRLEKGQRDIFEIVRELPSPEGFQRLRSTVTDHGQRIDRLEHPARK